VSIFPDGLDVQVEPPEEDEKCPLPCDCRPVSVVAAGRRDPVTRSSRRRNDAGSLPPMADVIAGSALVLAVTATVAFSLWSGPL
jgi:hypothetical protein